MKYKLETSPKCIKCRGPSKFYKTSNNSFLNIPFVTEWYQCNKCGKIHCKIIKKG
jgi:hypothetical protein